ncbi:MAG: hypothetical protein NT108_02670 [Candidatus Kaiserbacteria bacterium]|nr:hypothetical protein [Candidatus Kaiserbacteria bacterium]
MNPTSDFENPVNNDGSKRKTILIPIIGVLVGALIGAGIVAYLFRDSVFFSAPVTIPLSTLSYPDPNAQKVPDINLKSNILLPKKLVGEEYYLLINKIVDELRQVGTNNTTILIPLMDAIKQKSVSKDFVGLFDLVVQAKSEIKKDMDILMTTREDIIAMKKVTDTTVSDTDIQTRTNALLASGDVFVQTFIDYFSVMNETLSGSIPTQSLLDRLSQQVASLGKDGSVVQTEMNKLLTIIKQKNDAVAP